MIGEVVIVVVHVRVAKSHSRRPSLGLVKEVVMESNMEVTLVLVSIIVAVANEGRLAGSDIMVVGQRQHVRAALDICGAICAVLEGIVVNPHMMRVTFDANSIGIDVGVIGEISQPGKLQIANDHI